MKKPLIAFLIVLISLKDVAAADYRPSVDEWGLPRAMTTEADYRKYVKIKKRMFVVGLLAAAATIALQGQSTNFRRKANSIDVAPGDPYLHADSRVYEDIDPSLVEAQGRYLSKSRAYRDATRLAALTSVVCFSVAFSLRF